MKVLCIDGVIVGDIGKTNKGRKCIAKKKDEIYEGKVYTVVSEDITGKGYWLIGKGRVAYNKKKFIVTSKRDETKIKAKINHLI